MAVSGQEYGEEMKEEIESMKKNFHLFDLDFSSLRHQNEIEIKTSSKKQLRNLDCKNMKCTNI